MTCFQSTKDCMTITWPVVVDDAILGVVIIAVVVVAAWVIITWIKHCE